MVVHSRGRSGRPALGYFNDEGFFYVLSTGVVCVECLADGFFRAQNSFILDGVVGGFSTAYPEIDIGRIDASSKRVCVLAQNDIPHIIDEIVFVDYDPCS